MEKVVKPAQGDFPPHIDYYDRCAQFALFVIGDPRVLDAMVNPEVHRIRGVNIELMQDGRNSYMKVTPAGDTTLIRIPAGSIESFNLKYTFTQCETFPFLPLKEGDVLEGEHIEGKNRRRSKYLLQVSTNGCVATPIDREWWGDLGYDCSNKLSTP